MLFFPKKAILAKIESPYGTDAVPTGAANAILARNVSIVPIEAELIKREVVLPTFGTIAAIPAGASVKLDFEVDAAGSGSAAVPPPWGPLVRACGRAETQVSPAVDTLYAPRSSGFESISIYFHLDGLRHKLTGVRGKVSPSFNHNAIPSLKFSLIGIYNAPTDTALPALTLTAWQQPLPMNKVNTPTFTLHGVAAVLMSLEIDDGTVVNFRDYVNVAQDVRISGRECTGTAKIEADLLAFKDWFALARSGATGAMDLIHGTATGNKLQLEAATVQIGNPSYEDADGVTMLSLPLMFHFSGDGDNDYTLRAF
jgi:hypothetical protein